MKTLALLCVPVALVMLALGWIGYGLLYGAHRYANRFR